MFTPDAIRRAWPVLDALPFPVMHISADFTVLAANRAAAGSYGPGQGKCYRMSHGYDSACEKHGESCPKLAAERSGRPVAVFHVHQTRDGLARYRVSASPILGGGILELHVPLEDVTTRDALTGLVNRTEGEQLARRSAALMARLGRGYAVVMLDLDHFKVVNDTFGHPQGDRVLRAFAELLGNAIRQSDVLVRWGGEEFLVMLPGEETLAAEEFACRILDETRALCLAVGELPLSLTVSLGIRCVDSAEVSSVSFDEAVRDADEALYQAKRAGRDRHRLHLR